MANSIDLTSFHKFTYGLFVVSATADERDAGCIINTAIQVTSEPSRISVCVNKANYTHDAITKAETFALTALSEDAPFEVFQRFGFQSSRSTDKFTADEKWLRARCGAIYPDVPACARFSAKVIGTVDLGTHTMFIADVYEAETVGNAAAPMSYAYYFAHVKPAAPAKPAASAGKVWVCRICGYTYDEAKEGVPFEELPADWVCPMCKHPKSDFELA